MRFENVNFKKKIIFLLVAGTVDQYIKIATFQNYIC